MLSYFFVTIFPGSPCLPEAAIQLEKGTVSDYGALLSSLFLLKAKATMCYINVIITLQCS